jgi:hypothetical protein
VKRTNIEFMIGWLDALRRDDVGALKATLEPDVVWHGLREEWNCHGADEVIDTFAGRRDEVGALDALELIGAEKHVILHITGEDLGAIEDIPLPDGIYNVFAIAARRIVRIDDYGDRHEALAAVGLVRR